MPDENKLVERSQDVNLEYIKKKSEREAELRIAAFELRDKMKKRDEPLSSVTDEDIKKERRKLKELLNEKNKENKKLYELKKNAEKANNKRASLNNERYSESDNNIIRSYFSEYKFVREEEINKTIKDNSTGKLYKDPKGLSDRDIFKHFAEIESAYSNNKKEFLKQASLWINMCPTAYQGKMNTILNRMYFDKDIEENFSNKAEEKEKKLTVLTDTQIRKFNNNNNNKFEDFKKVEKGDIVILADNALDYNNLEYDSKRKHHCVHVKYMLHKDVYSKYIKDSKDEQEEADGYIKLSAVKSEKADLSLSALLETSQNSAMNIGKAVKKHTISVTRKIDKNNTDEAFKDYNYNPMNKKVKGTQEDKKEKYPNPALMSEKEIKDIIARYENSGEYDYIEKWSNKFFTQKNRIYEIDEKDIDKVSEKRPEGILAVIANTPHKYANIYTKDAKGNLKSKSCLSENDQVLVCAKSDAADKTRDVKFDTISAESKLYARIKARDKRGELKYYYVNSEYISFSVGNKNNFFEKATEEKSNAELGKAQDNSENEFSDINKDKNGSKVNSGADKNPRLMNNTKIVKHIRKIADDEKKDIEDKDKNADDEKIKNGVFKAIYNWADSFPDQKRRIQKLFETCVKWENGQIKLYNWDDSKDKLEINNNNKLTDKEVKYITAEVNKLDARVYKAENNAMEYDIKNNTKKLGKLKSGARVRVVIENGSYVKDTKNPKFIKVKFINENMKSQYGFINSNNIKIYVEKNKIYQNSENNKNSNTYYGEYEGDSIIETGLGGIGTALDIANSFLGIDSSKIKSEDDIKNDTISFFRDNPEKFREKIGKNEKLKGLFPKDEEITEDKLREVLNKNSASNNQGAKILISAFTDEKNKRKNLEEFDSEFANDKDVEKKEKYEKIGAVTGDISALIELSLSFKESLTTLLDDSSEWKQFVLQVGTSTSDIFSNTVSTMQAFSENEYKTLENISGGIDSFFSTMNDLIKLIKLSIKVNKSDSSKSGADKAKDSSQLFNTVLSVAKDGLGIASQIDKKFKIPIIGSCIGILKDIVNIINDGIQWGKLHNQEESMKELAGQLTEKVDENADDLTKEKYKKMNKEEDLLEISDNYENNKDLLELDFKGGWRSPEENDNYKKLKEKAGYAADLYATKEIGYVAHKTKNTQKWSFTEHIISLVGSLSKFISDLSVDPTVKTITLLTNAGLKGVSSAMSSTRSIVKAIRQRSRDKNSDNFKSTSSKRKRYNDVADTIVNNIISLKGHIRTYDVNKDNKLDNEEKNEFKFKINMIRQQIHSLGLTTAQFLKYKGNYSGLHNLIFSALLKRGL